jgi:hypothetical protein
MCPFIISIKTQEKYQKELVHHASDVQALTAAKEQVTFYIFVGRMKDTLDGASVGSNGYQGTHSHESDILELNVHFLFVFN